MKSPAAELKLADFVVEFLAEQNINAVFLVPGGGSMHLCDALARNGKVEFVPTHHEQSAAIAAEAYARVTGGVGCVLVTTGPGGTNAMTAVAGSWIESIPLLVISGQVKRSDLKRESGVRQRGVQEVDVISMVKPITKYAKLVENPNDIRFELERALQIAVSGRKGPVWLDIPLDVQSALIDPQLLRSGLAPERPCHAPQSVVLGVIDQINNAHRPVLLVGHGVRLSSAERDFLECIELLNIPVLTTWNAMDLIPDSHPLSMGKPGVVALRGPNFIVQNSDLIVCVGARLDNLVTAYNLEKFGRHARKIVVDVDEFELEKFSGTSHSVMTVHCDAKNFFRQILNNRDALRPQDQSEWIRYSQEVKNRYPINDGKPFPMSGTITSPHFVQVLSDLIPPDTLVCTGSSGLCMEAFYTGFSTKPDQRVFLNTGLGAMGYGLPSAIGAGVALQGRRFVTVESDGSLMMNLQELLTLNTLNLPICMFVMNNRGYGSIRNTQRNYFDGRYIGTGPESRLGFPNFRTLAESIGIETMLIEDVSHLRTRVQEALSHPGPLLVDVMIEPNESLWPKASSIAREDGSMVSMPLEDMSPLLSQEELASNMLNPLDEVSFQVRR